MNLNTGKSLVFSFFGAPGSGKGTLAGLSVQNLGFKSLSTGDLCRYHVALQTDLGKKIAQCLASGNLISDEMVTTMVADWLQENILVQPLILDGYPRTKKQAEMFFDLLSKQFQYVTYRVIVFDIKRDVVTARLIDRLVCGNGCQFIGSKPANTCPLCLGQLVKRNDDTREVIEQRFAAYDRYREEVLSCYQENEIRVDVLPVDNLLPDQVFEEFKKVL